MARVRNAVLRKATGLLSRGLVFSNHAVSGVVTLPAAPPDGAVRHALRTLGAFCGEGATLGTHPAAKITGPDWTIVFVGSAPNRTEIENIFFKGVEHRVENLGRLPRAKIAESVSGWLASGVDLVIHEHWTDDLMPGRSGPLFRFTTPSFVDQIIDLPEEIETLIAGKKNANRRNRINKSLKDGYEPAILTDRADLETFHSELYVPYISTRYGDRSMMTPLGQLAKRFEKGMLVAALHDGQPAAAKICYLDGEMFYNDDMGFHPDAEEFRRTVGATVLDWFCLQVAHEKGAKRLNMGGSRSWITDGVYQYKRSWTAKAGPRGPAHPRWSFFASDMPPALIERINQIGFIAELDGALWLARLAAGDPSAELDAGTRAAKAAEAAEDGLAGIAVLPAAGGAAQTTPASSS